MVDVVFDAGVFQLELANIGAQPAFDVSCRFEPALRDVNGRDVNELALFRHVPTLLPGKRIRTILDSSAAFFLRGEPTAVDVTIEYSGVDGERRRTRLAHDLAVYRDVAYLT